MKTYENTLIVCGIVIAAFTIFFTSQMVLDSYSDNIINVINQKNREQSLFFQKTHDILELQETLHSKQNEIDEMRSNQQKLQDNYEEIIVKYVSLEDEIDELRDHVKILEDERDKRKGLTL